MRVLILNYEFPPLGGGAGNATFYLLKEFSKYPDLKIDLVTSSTGKFEIENFSENIKIHKLDIGKNSQWHNQSQKDLLVYSWKALNYAKKIIKINSYDLIHAFLGLPGGYLALKLKKRFKIPYLVSLRGSDVPGHNPKYAFLDRILFRRLAKKIWQNAKAVIANSEDLKKEALSTAHLEIEVIPNGVDTAFYKNTKEKKDAAFRLLYAGRLAKVKGLEYLIQSIVCLKELFLVLAGDGPEKENLQTLVKSLNLENQVKFTGRLDKNSLLKEYQKADLFILPSLREGMSNTLLEAMACGLPVITTNTGGSQELIQGNGFIVNKADSEAIKSAIQKYLNDKNLSKIHGQKSRALAEKMSWEKVAEKYHIAYQKNLSLKYEKIVRETSDSEIIQKWRTCQEEIIRYLKNFDRNLSILELGSGRGFMIKELIKNGFHRITGSDFNPANLELAKKINQVELKNIDAENLSLPPNSYNIVIALELIEHLPNVNKNIKEVKKILRKNGIYILSTPNLVIEKIYDFIRRKKDELHISLQTHHSIKKALKNEEFSVTFLKMNKLSESQKSKLGFLRFFYPIRFLPKILQPSIICVARLEEKNELA